MTKPIFAAALLAALSACSVSEAAAKPPLAPKPQLVVPNKAETESAIFAGGCFWGVEGVFEQVKGVKSAVSGYAGGTGEATYHAVGTGRTGHAEAVRVTFDPRVISYAQLMQVFFSVITDPTQLNRQGPDYGTQYRNSLFPLTKAQDKQARAYLAQLSKARIYKNPIVTKIETRTSFYPAEDYHQDFMRLNPRNPYILAHDRPKVIAFRDQFASLAR